jgi:hypothetical protein
MATVDGTRSTAQELAAERFKLAIDLAVDGRSPYPGGAAFVAADQPDLGVWMARYAREHRPVVLVYPDGDERVLLAVPAASRWRALVEDAFRALGRLLRRAGATGKA